MVPEANQVGAARARRKRTKGPFKGVRMRKWGRWVSEIRVPQSRTRIWLGSYDTPEKAARAYDAALYCLRGSKGKFNFPDEKRPELPSGTASTFSTNEIKAVASRFASPECLPVPSSTSSFTSTTSSPDVPILEAESDSTWELGDLQYTADLKEQDMYPPDSFLLDDPIIRESDSIWNILDETTNFRDL